MRKEILQDRITALRKAIAKVDSIVDKAILGNILLEYKKELIYGKESSN